MTKSKCHNCGRTMREEFDRDWLMCSCGVRLSRVMHEHLTDAPIDYARQTQRLQYRTEQRNEAIGALVTTKARSAAWKQCARLWKGRHHQVLAEVANKLSESIADGMRSVMPHTMSEAAFRKAGNFNPPTFEERQDQISEVEARRLWNPTRPSIAKIRDELAERDQPSAAEKAPAKQPRIWYGANEE